MDVLCVGHAAWDVSLFLDDYPAENAKREIREMLECGGGPAANAAYLLAGWGVKCGIAAAIGADEYGDRIVEEFHTVGAETSCLEQNPHNTTPVSVILVNQTNGSRTIVNRKAVREGSPFQLPAEALKGVSPKVLLFDGHELQAALQAMEWFPEARTILDAGSSRDGTRELSRRVDYLVSSERFARQFSGVENLDTPENQDKAFGSLYSHNGNAVVITRGEKDVLHGRPGEIRRYPPLKVPTVDTTAAGDIFHGAFSYGVLREFPIDRTLRFACAAAALSVRVRGGRTSVPSLAAVEEMLDHAG
ncbi:MAG: carbohydrate kinase [Phycisphaerae bacterium]|nr:carbohydrate kinase [Phycisphaerae bacterium]